MMDQKRNNSITGLSDAEVRAMEDTFGANHYGRLGIVPRSWEGAYLYDSRGNKYLDCLGAYSAANQGHHHPVIARALIKAISGNYASVISNVPYVESFALFMSKLSCLAPVLGPRFGGSYNRILPKNGGVESVETAIKIARYYGYDNGIKDGEQEIILFDNNFHGRTITVVSASSTEKYSRGFGGQNRVNFKLVPFGDWQAVENAVSPNTCGIMVEPMQGEGGMNIPPKGFLKELRRIADDNDLILVFDEIQVGLGRTGKMFCFEHENVIPDVLVLGKALSGGLWPLSVAMANNKLIEKVFSPGRDGSTYGGCPAAGITGLAALKVIRSDKLVDRSRTIGQYLKEGLSRIAARVNTIKEVRGQGLFMGVEVKNNDAMDYCRKLLAHGVFTNDSHGHTIRISPPLIIGYREANLLLEAFRKVFLGK